MLLGALLIGADGVALRIREVEAYGGQGEDPASHAYRGPTPRTAAMFGPVARLYVYRSYGIHLCMNVVAHEAGGSGGVLLRAGEVLAGVRIAHSRRGQRRPMADGPGRLGQAMGVALADNGCDLTDPEGRFRLGPPMPVPPQFAMGPRIGVTQARDAPLRFRMIDQPVADQ